MAMWGRKDPEPPRPAAAPVREAAVTPQPTTAQAVPERGATMSTMGLETRKAIIGPSIHIKGELIGNEDLVIEGRVEGVVRLRDHHLTIGKSAHIQATVEAKSIRIEGTVNGDVIAGERLEVANGGTLNGDIISPRIAIADGARFKGSVDMEKNTPRTGVPTAQAQSHTPAPAHAGAPSGAQATLPSQNRTAGVGQ
jgi:cytoskeletal protein CcmA (bactofilin family)